MVVMVLLMGILMFIFDFISRKQRGGRILYFTEDEFNLKSYIIQEDGTVEEQEPQPDKGVKQDMCDQMHPPHSIYQEIDEL